jgi:hypothetical protein
VVGAGVICTEKEELVPFIPTKKGKVSCQKRLNLRAILRNVTNIEKGRGIGILMRVLLCFFISLLTKIIILSKVVGE